MLDPTYFKQGNGGSGRRFTALQTFESSETQSVYAAGLVYTARTMLLDTLVDQWINEGKVQLGGGAASLSGKGE